MPALRHHPIALVPMIALVILSMVVEQWSYHSGMAILFTGSSTYIPLIMWILLGQLAG